MRNFIQIDFFSVKPKVIPIEIHLPNLENTFIWCTMWCLQPALIPYLGMWRILNLFVQLIIMSVVYVCIIQNKLNNNIYCIQESFNTNISLQLFEYKITFVNSYLENTNSKGDFVLKNWFESFFLKMSDIQK